MFSVTYLGHQGWMVATKSTRILVDPLLEDYFGCRRTNTMVVYPPRRFDFGAFPRVDAVFLSHEHDDHYQLNSLNRLSRKIPIFLSERSSTAGHAALTSMGFDVRPLRARTPVRVGDLELEAHIPDFLRNGLADEWDCMPYLIRDTGGHGSFFSSVDVSVPKSIIELTASKATCPLVWTWTNNFSSRHALTNWRPRPGGSLAIVGALANKLDVLQRSSARPALLLGSGGGWAFSGELTWLNRAFFPADNQRVAEGMQLTGIDVETEILAPLPGDTTIVESGAVRETVKQGSPFVSAAPRAAWPNRTYDPKTERNSNIAPLFPGPISAAGLDELHQRLQHLAEALTGGGLFLALASLTKEELGNKRRSFVLFLQTSADGEGCTYEYSPAACRFLPCDYDVLEAAAGAGCWAQDLLALLRCETSAAMFTMGHIFEWLNCKPSNPDALQISTQLWPIIHPLRRPDDFGRFYAQQIEALPKEVAGQIEPAAR